MDEKNIVEPNTVEPNTVEPNIVAPNTVEPNTVEPNTVEPNTVEPNTVEPNTVEPKYMDSVSNFIEARDLNFETLKTVLNQATSDELIALAKKILEDFLKQQFGRPKIYNDPYNDFLKTQSSKSKQSINDAISKRKEDIRYLIVFYFLINHENLKDSNHSIFATLLEKKTEILYYFHTKIDRDFADKEIKKNKVKDVNVIRDLESYLSPENKMTQADKDDLNRRPIKEFFNGIYTYFGGSIVVRQKKKIEEEETTSYKNMFGLDNIKTTALGESKKNPEFYKDYITILSNREKSYSRSDGRPIVGNFYYLRNYLKIDDDIQHDSLVATPYPLIGMLIMFQSILISKGILTKEEAPFPEPEESVALPFAKPTIGLKIANAVRSVKNTLGFKTNDQLGGKRKSKSKTKKNKKQSKKSRKRH
jgi:hypothetical protein